MEEARVIRIADFKLVSIEEKHLEIVLRWRNSNEIRTMMYTDKIISLEEHWNWFESFRNSNKTIIKILLYLGEPIGLVNFNKINAFDNKCYWGFYIGALDAPKGAGTILGYLALNYIFETQSIRKVCSEIIGYNTQSIKFHQRMGFAEEGRLVEHINKGNEFIDVVLMAQFEHQWRHNKNNLKKKLEGAVK